ncbi:unnamed protein product [Prorocentrum cordatum]|uniref:Uncharacterized protein n=1 Tax=Prorocentrum cordatum TaxID=2364126 RepID=A0ABN9SAJ7_9DINO|nr:unnamed protein product [Polarella glacialis]
MHRLFAAGLQLVAVTFSPAASVDETQAWTSGYPLRLVDASAPGVDAGLNELALSVMPSTSHFQSLGENEVLCSRGEVEGWQLYALRGDGGPPADAIAGWVRRGALLRTVAEFCPQAVLLVLARHVESVLLAMRGPDPAADLQEAGLAQLKYGLLKSWLGREVFPHAPWDLVVRGWGLEEREARIFESYKSILSQVSRSRNHEPSKVCISQPGDSLAGRAAPVPPPPPSHPPSAAEAGSSRSIHPRLGRGWEEDQSVPERSGTLSERSGTF